MNLDVGSAYRRGREDVAALVRTLGSEQLHTQVPACPGWTVHDIVSHLTGLAVDALRGGSRGVPTDDQTAAQVERHKGDPTSIVLREWERAASQYEMILTKTGPSAVAAAIGVVVHEHDIRGALGLPGNRDSTLVDLAIERAVDLWFSKIDSAGLPDVVIHDDADEVVAGRFEAPVAFRASRFEFFRAAYGRRSRGQIERRLHGTDDPAPYVPLLCIYDPASQDLVE